MQCKFGQFYLNVENIRDIFMARHSKVMGEVKEAILCPYARMSKNT